jgi:hypothetical protein
MLGRSLRYFVYYVSGYLFGKSLVNQLEYKSSQLKVLGMSILGFLIIIMLKSRFEGSLYFIELLDCFEIFSIILFLFVLFRNVYKVPLLYPFKYYGLNSYIVFGMHEIYHTTIRIILQNLFGEVTITLGVVQTIITLLLLWPTIWLFNKNIPVLVGKKELIKVPVE